MKIDPNKYKGMSVEEARRAMAEYERRAFNEDPRTIAVVRAAERREAERRAEQRRRIEEDERQQQAEAAAELEDERARLLRIWIASGGTESEFETEWPERKRKILAGRVEAFEREREREAFTA